MDLKEKLYKFRIIGIVFTAFEVVMHSYLTFFLLANWDGSGIQISALVFTVFEVVMNAYLLGFLLVHKANKPEMEARDGWSRKSSKAKVTD